MGKAEKGYFKKYSSLHTIGEKNNYVSLFDAIEKQASKSALYNEELIKKNFDERFNRQLPVVKNYLYSAVLESLRLFHSSHSADSRVRHLIAEYDILMDKVLVKQASEVLKQAKRLAEKNELFSDLLKILSREKRIARFTKDPSVFEKYFETICREETLAVRKLENVNDFVNLRHKIEQFTFRLGTGYAREEIQQKEVLDFLNDPLLRSEGVLLSRTAKKFYFQFKGNLYSYMNERISSYSYHRKYIALLEEDVCKTTVHQPLLAALNNIVTEEVRLGKFDNAEETLNKLKNYEKIFSVSLNESEKAFLVYSLITLGISFSIEDLNLQRGREILVNAERMLKGYEEKIITGRLLIIYYFLSSFSLIDANYAVSSKWLSKILQFPATDFSSDYQCYARIMNLIVQYELKNFEHLEYAMKSTYYFLRKRKKIYRYEQIIIKYMKRSLRANTEKALVELYSEMKYELELIINDSYEKNAFDAFNIIPWLVSKIENITFLEAIKQQQKK